MRILRNAALGLGGLLVVLGIAAVLILRSGWFRDYVRQTIISSTEDSTGGRTEVGTLSFEWTHLTAVMTDFVIHGTEQSGSPPMLRVAHAQMNLRLFTSLHHLWDIAYLGADRPQVNVIVYSDGHTNIPSPHTKPTSNESPLETVVDLAIGRFEITNGLIAVAAQKSELNIRGNNLRAQLSYNTLSQEYRGQVSLQPIYMAAGRNTPVNFTMNVPLVLARNGIEVRDARIFSSQSAVTLNASLQDPRNPKISAHATGHIAIADLPLSMKAANASPVIELDANISDVNNAIEVEGLRLSLGHSNIEASGNLNSGVAFHSHLALGELGRLVNAAALPDEVANVNGTATLDSRNTYRVRADVKNLDLASALRATGTSLSYEGVVSGPINITGNLNTGLRSFALQTNLSIASLPQANPVGIPVEGKLTASYTAATDNLSIQNSLLTLPHTRLTVDGSVGKQLNIAMTTTNLDDLLAAIPAGSRPPIALDAGGQASFTGNVTGSLRAPQIAGHVIANRFSIAGRRFDTVNADASATKDNVAIQNGSVSRNAMQTRFSGTLGLRDWKPMESAPLSVDASIQNGDLADLLALAGQPSRDFSGKLNAKASIHGTLGNPQGAGTLDVTNGIMEGQRFDRAQAQVNVTGQLITVANALVQMGASRANLSGEFQHPRDNFTTGQLRADVQGDQINLAQLSFLQKLRPNTSGIIQFHANVAGNLSGEVQLTSVSGSASVHGLQSEGQAYGDLTANATTMGQSVNYNVTSNFAGSNIDIGGSTQLTRDYPSSARAKLANLPMQRVLAAVNRTDIPVQGLLSGTANFNGTMSHPQGSADVTVSNATIYDDAVDRVHLTARYDSPGALQFRMDPISIDLARFKTLTDKQPGLTGTLQVSASGAAEIRASEPRVLVRDINANLKADGLAIKGRGLGNLTFAATTANGRVNFTLNSGIAGAAIEGRGDVQLTNGYPTDAKLTVKNVSWAGLRSLVGYSAGEGRGFEASGDGEVSVNGPLTDIDKMRGSVQVTRLQVSGTSSGFRKAVPVVLQNQGALAASLDGGTLKIQSAHLTGPQTDFDASGTVPLNGQAMEVALKGNVNLAILQQFDQSITSSGGVVLTASVRGTPSNPRVIGQIELHNSSFDYVNLPTGVWKANGLIALNGTSAVIRNLTAQAGGGQITVTGSATLPATFNDTLRFGLQAKGSRVRVAVQQGVSVVASAEVALSGTTDSSVVSGTVTVDQVSYAARSDLGSLLSLAAPPVQTPVAPLPLFENMRLDLRVRSSSALALRASVAQDLQLTADLRVRGSAANPGILGRVTITEGKLVFFGSTYTVNAGNIAFYNPVRVEPILDLSLETQTQGVDVTLRVTGPIDNMKLSYTSDPPLQFQEIVSLLATGTTPTSDPTLLANQPTVGAQSFQQMGESAIVSKALADPVTNQLQRVFGVTQLKINPAFTSGSQLPEAQITLQQQISSNVTFTYISGLSSANGQTIQAVWTFSPRWSAQALEDTNGIVSVTLLYKRQLR